MMIDQIPNNQLSECCQGEHQERVPSHERRGVREVGQPLFDYLGQSKGCTLKDQTPHRSRKEDDRKYLQKRSSVYSARLYARNMVGNGLMRRRFCAQKHQVGGAN